MSAIFVNGGLAIFLQNLLNITEEGSLVLDLYTDNVLPGVTDVIGDYTLCALDGYAALTLTPGSWSGGAVAGVATYTFPASTFTFSDYAGGTTIYGYVITVGGVLVAAEKYPVPYDVPAELGELVVAPKATLRRYVAA